MLQRFREVAVARPQFLEQAHVLDGDHRLIGEGLEQRDVRVGERPGLFTRDGNGPDRATVSQHGHGQYAPEAQRPLKNLRGRLSDVRDMDNGAVQDSPPDGDVCRRWPRKCPLRDLERLRVEVGVSDEVHRLAVVAEETAEQAVAQPVRALDDGVEHRLDVGGRTGDDAQDLGGGGLLRERLGEVAVARPQLLEQADVLDGDDRLIREGSEQVDLPVREGRGRFARDRDQAEGDVPPHHRHHEASAVAPQPGEFDLLRAGLRVVLDVGQMEDAALADHARGVIPGRERDRELRPEPLEPLRADAVRRGHPQHVPLDHEHHAAQGPAYPDAAAGDPLEDRLRVGRRGPDDPQDLGRGRLLLQRFREALLELASPSRSLGLDFRLRGLCAPTHAS